MSEADPLRIVFTGSESTGKTTLSRAIAARLGAEWVGEYVREYVDAVGRAPEFGDHGAIARGQMAAEDRAMENARAKGAKYVVQDTDLLSTLVYCAHYFGHAPEWIANELHHRLPALYILCDIDVPWVADGQRDRGDAREEMHALFLDAVRRSGAKYVELRGLGAERERGALGAIASLDKSDGLRATDEGRQT